MSEILIPQNIWEEKNSIEPKKKLENNPILDLKNITNKIKKNVIKKEWRDIGKKKIISGIYKIINKINGKYYVGYSKNITARWRNHRCNLNKGNHKNKHLQRTWNRDKNNNFDFVIIEEISENILSETEQKYLDIARKEKNKCYNLSFISDKIEMTPEIIDKIIKSNKNRICSPEQKEKLSISHRDKTVHHFKNIKTGEVFDGIMYDFKIKTKIGPSNLYRLMNGELKQLNGWIFIKL